MNIDHIFIFSNQRGIEADHLKKIGLTEGSNRTHKGQGTKNRKFYFQNFFLEIIWVHSEKEIKSKKTRPTKLWERSNFDNNTYSRFGLCLVNEIETDRIFKSSFRYQPDYFPANRSIDVLTNANKPHLPWTFRLPFRGKKTTNNIEKLNHENGIRNLTKAIFKIATYKEDDNYIKLFDEQKQLKFKEASENSLHLVFDNKHQNKSYNFPLLNLKISY